MKLIYKDSAGNILYKKISPKGKVVTFHAKNVKGEVMTKHGLHSMMKEKGISTKGLIEKYIGSKRK